jgi:transcriptional regulator with XRE-family HTH domain
MSSKGRRIREIRRRLGLTQFEFADRVKTTQGTISRWESGDQEPEISALVKIAELVGLDPIKFAIYDEEHPFRTSDWGKRVIVIGAIQWDHWAESVAWEENDQFQVQIPTLEPWGNLRVAGFVVRDDSADALYPRDSVVFAGIVPGTIDPPPPVDELDNWQEATTLIPRHGDIVIVRRRSNDGLVELTLRKYYINSEGEEYVTPISTNPKYASYRIGNASEGHGSAPPPPVAGEPEVIGIILCGFKIEAPGARFD